MKKLQLTAALLSLILLAGCGAPASSSEGSSTETVAPGTQLDLQAPPATKMEEPPMDTAAMAEAWEAYMTPTDMHKWLASADGKWKAEMTFWQGPDMPPSSKSTASVETRMVMGGRYQETIYKGKMMGMDFEGKGTIAYDNAKKKFISTWIDNTGTGLMVMEGNYDEATRSMNMTGKMVDPSTGKDCDMREVMKVIDDKTHVMEMYSTQNGVEFKNMEIRLTRM